MAAEASFPRIKINITYRSTNILSGWSVPWSSCKSYRCRVIIEENWVFHFTKIIFLIFRGEQKASRALREASEIIGDSPAALQLRYLQVNIMVIVAFLTHFIAPNFPNLDFEHNLVGEELNNRVSPANRSAHFFYEKGGPSIEDWRYDFHEIFRVYWASSYRKLKGGCFAAANNREDKRNHFKIFTV